MTTKHGSGLSNEGVGSKHALAEGPPTYAHFTPAELAQMTGLNVELQRVWRRRNQLPVGRAGSARFTTQEVAAAMIRHRLSQMGKSPSETIEIGAEFAPYLLWCALMEGDSICEVWGTTDDVNVFEQDFYDHEHIADWLAEIEGDTGRSYFALLDGEKPFVFSPGAELLNSQKFELAYLLNLETLGRKLALDAPRPLVVVNLRATADSAAEPQDRIRRILKKSHHAGSPKSPAKTARTKHDRAGKSVS